MAIVSLAGCMVGPNFKKPRAPRTHFYTEEGAKEEHNPYFRFMERVPRNWWVYLESPTLNRLILRGLENSPDIAAASAVLKQAEESLKALVVEKLYPSVDANFSATRQKFSASQFGNESATSTIFNFFATGINVTYNLDLFGRSRRQIEDLCAQVDYQRYQFEGVQLTLAANIATAAIAQASYVGQIEGTKELLHAQSDQLTILQKQFDLGAGSYQSVLTQETLVEATRAKLYALELNLAQTRHLLAILIGQFPSENCYPNVTFAELKIPEVLPVTLPSQLVRQRPDIRAQEALLHRATAQVGVAIANFFPQINLSANYGWQSNLIGDLFNSKANVWSMAANVTQPVWNAGRLFYDKNRAQALVEETKANYQKTVLAAFAQVADAMKAIEYDDRALKAQRKAEKAAKDSLVLAKRQFEMGAVDFLTLLIAERAYQETLINRIQVQEKRTTDVVALFQALGGGFGICEGERHG